MTDASIKQKALTAANALLGTDRITLGQLSHQELMLTLVHVVEQSEEFKQEVSDAVEIWRDSTESDSLEVIDLAEQDLLGFIISKAKPDPLVEVLLDMELSSDQEEGQHDAKWLRLKLDALGFEIREKGQ
jgi:hypothetical protein